MVGGEDHLPVEGKGQFSLKKVTERGPSASGGRRGQSQTVQYKVYPLVIAMAPNISNCSSGFCIATMISSGG